ncbi:MAG TPA: nucleobase:cation symporter-2 family protein [Burkholderiaceae bacterium]
MSDAVHPVDEKLPLARLAALGLQHVLVMYAGAIAVPLIIGRALKLAPEQVALLISADLFCCGLVSIIQSLGIGRALGIRLPVMMGVTFAAVGPLVAMANAHPGVEGARAIFGAIIGAGIVATLLAPLMSRLLRFFPPVVTGTIIAVIGITLMRVGIGWAMGGPPNLAQNPDPAYLQSIEAARSAAAALPASAMAPTAVVDTQLAAAIEAVRQAATALPKGTPKLLDNPQYADLFHLALSAFVLVTILLITKYAKGFTANIAVLLGIVAGGIVAFLLGRMNFDKVAKAAWVDLVTPLSFGMPTFDPVMIVTLVLVMVVVMIESTRMFLALSEITGKPIGPKELTAGLRTDGVGTIIGGLFNTFPYTSFSQNVGLVGVTGVRSRYVCVAGGVVMIVLGLLPKMAALVESLPQFVLGGAGLVMFGMVAATGVRILGSVDFKSNRYNLYIVAISISAGMIPIVAPRWTQHMAKALHPLLESGILLAAVAAVLLNLFFNGARGDARDAIGAAKMAEAH